MNWTTAYCCCLASKSEALGEFRHKWKDCFCCPLHKRRKKIVLFRGQIPADVVLIGEAPGESEDQLGYPFVGEAGKVLDQMIEESKPKREPPHPTVSSILSSPLRIAITNVVCCLPSDPRPGSTGQLRPPSKEEITACRPRLEDFLTLTSPRLLVTLGRVAERAMNQYAVDWIARGQSVYRLAHLVSLIHPSAILQAPETKQHLLYKRAVTQLTTALKELS